MLSRKGKNNENGSFNWKDAVIDAAITAGITLCVTGGAMVSTGVIYTKEGVATLFFATLGQFLGFLAIKRGLREKE